MTQCYDCRQRITRPEKARVRLLDEVYAIVVCLRCRPRHPSRRMYSPKQGLPSQSKVRIPGGESR